MQVRRQARRGMELAEFAVIAPLLVLISLAALDFGRFAHAYLAVTNAARSGAGVGSFQPYPTQETQGDWQARVQQAIEDELTALHNYDEQNLTPAPVIEAINEGGGEWHVRVVISYQFHTLIDWQLIPTSATLQREVIVPGVNGEAPPL